MRGVGSVKQDLNEDGDGEKGEYLRLYDQQDRLKRKDRKGRIRQGVELVERFETLTILTKLIPAEYPPSNIVPKYQSIIIL